MPGPKGPGPAPRVFPRTLLKRRPARRTRARSNGTGRTGRTTTGPRERVAGPRPDEPFLARVTARRGGRVSPGVPIGNKSQRKRGGGAPDGGRGEGDRGLISRWRGGGVFSIFDGGGPKEARHESLRISLFAACSSASFSQWSGVHQPFQRMIVGRIIMQFGLILRKMVLDIANRWDMIISMPFDWKWDSYKNNLDVAGMKFYIVNPQLRSDAAIGSLIEISSSKQRFYFSTEIIFCCFQIFFAKFPNISCAHRNNDISFFTNCI